MQLNLQPQRRTLQQFGVVAAVMLPALGWWFGAPVSWMTVLGAIAAASLAVAAVYPASLRIPFVVLSLLTAPIGIVVGEVLTVCVYVGVFTPMAIVMRLIGRDPLDRRLPTDQATYWTRKPAATNPGRYLRQY